MRSWQLPLVGRALAARNGFSARAWLLSGSVVLVGFAVATAVYAHLIAQERLRALYDLDVEARRAHEKLDAQLRERILALVRIARRWEVAGMPAQNVWEPEVLLLLQHDRGYQAVEWADSSAHIRWIVPLQGNELAMGLDLLPPGDDERSSRRRDTLIRARQSREPVASRTLQLAQGGRGFVVQVSVGGGKQGYILGVFRMDETIRTILGDDFAARFDTTIYDGQDLAFGAPPTSDTHAWRRTLMLDVYGVPWKLVFSPRQATLDGLHSREPQLISLCVGGMAALMAMVTYLAVATRESARQLARLSEARARFLALMSHEIRTPLNGLMGTLSILLDQPLDAESLKLAEIMRVSGQRLLTIVNDVLDLSKLEAGKVQVETVPFDPHRLVNDTLEVFRAAGTASQVQLVAEVAATVPHRVRADVHRLGQILINLVGNALKFTQRGEVRLVVHADAIATTAATLRFEVRDSGVGMAPHVVERLFEPFIQAEASTTREFGGTGLGLFICKEWLGLMGGSIAVKSAPGEGSSFLVTLPVQVEDAAAETVVPEVVAALGTVRRVLVVEDNAVNRMVTLHVLKRLGYAALAVPDGREALDILGRETFDAVLMDYNMPVMDGVETTRQLRSRGQKVPVIALTAATLQEDQAACLAAGMNAFVTKPVDRDVLGRTLAQLIA